MHWAKCHPVPVLKTSLLVLSLANSLNHSFAAQYILSAALLLHTTPFTPYLFSVGQAHCCCRHLLYTQCNFTLQKSLLQERVESHSHLCDYYPKYHCKLNFIKQYWGAAKFQFHAAGCMKTLEEMEKKMLECLDNVPLEQIQQYVTISYIFHVSHFQNLFADLQTGPCALFPHIVKACPVPK